MVVTECKFDPVHDLKAVEPFGFVDLKESYINNCVPSQTPEGDSDYNGIEDPSSIVGKPDDIFDALRLAQSLEEVAKSDDKKESD